MNDKPSPSYQRSSLHLVIVLLSIWATISFGCSILFRDWLDVHAPSIGNAPFGFWMAQQGSIIGFVLLLLAYALLMARLDEKHGYREGGRPKK
jgi:putative solute:sodium symporter small subunit